ncbi:MAG: hypothetical protein V4611_03540 [Patescibacteria group bacterium]
MSTEAEPTFLINEIRYQLELHEPNYEAGDLTGDEISRQVFTGILGGINVGKTHLTDAVVKLNEFYKPPILPMDTHTTRGDKDEDPPGFKTANDDINFTWFRDRVNEGALVNYSVIKGGHIYGTMPEGFRGKYNIGPLLPSSVRQIENAGFERANFAYIVTPAIMWRRFVENSRQTMQADLFQMRLDEMHDSLIFADENRDKLKFIENIYGPEGTAKAAKEIRDITIENINPSLSVEKAMQDIYELLEAVDELALH